jgi:hypothetical protein
MGGSPGLSNHVPRDEDARHVLLLVSVRDLRGHGGTTVSTVDDDDLPLSARAGGHPADSLLHEGVPDWLLHPLLDWLKRQLRPWAVRQIALRMRIALAGSEEPPALCDELERRAASPDGRWDVLDAISYLVQMNWDDLALPEESIGTEPLSGSEPLARLDYILESGGSAYRVANQRLGLGRRAGEHTEAMFQRAAAAAGGSAGQHLRRAWDEAYGLHPDPTTAYREAVRAVEAMACPSILPSAPRPTLGTVIDHLKQATGKWEVRIPGRDADGAASGVRTLIAMLELLWTGQVSRHAGSPASRDQLPVEAEAALPLASTIVHWFAIDAIRRAR